MFDKLATYIAEFEINFKEPIISSSTTKLSSTITKKAEELLNHYYYSNFIEHIKAKEPQQFPEYLAITASFFEESPYYSYFAKYADEQQYPGVQSLKEGFSRFLNGIAKTVSGVAKGGLGLAKSILSAIPTGLRALLQSEQAEKQTVLGNLIGKLAKGLALVTQAPSSIILEGIISNAASLLEMGVDKVNNFLDQALEQKQKQDDPSLLQKLATMFIKKDRTWGQFFKQLIGYGDSPLESAFA